MITIVGMKWLVKGLKSKKLEKQLRDDSIKASEIDENLVTGYKGTYNRYVKRIMDFILALILFICLFPIFIVISIAIVLEDGFPVFYRAVRGGYHNEPFKIYKFRSMVKNADKIGGGTTELHDKRITKVGAFIRKVKFDEIANLICVLNGTMSFIGPRPELLKYTSQYCGTEKKIFEVRPGMTDYSSIEFINLDEIVGTGNADEMYEQYVLPIKNKLRIKYAATVSLTTDIKLFCLTIYKVIEKAYGFIVKKQHR